jgi:ribonucleoside-triphosphate reductase
LQHIFNCCLVNLYDILWNGTVINKKLIERPKSLHTACTVATQVVQQIANGQYGGQTISLSHLAPFVRISYNKYLNKYKDRGCTLEDAATWAMEDVKDEINAGMQTIQYQINTLMTTNGQSPFVTLFLELDEKDPYIEETAEIIEELFKQRIQ